MKIAFFETNAEEEAVLSELMAPLSKNGITYDFIDDKLSETNIDKAADAEIVSVFVFSEMKKDLIDRLPKLKFITTRSTGFDHIDIAYCKTKGITVCNVPAYGSRTVAEFAFALMLGLSRRTFLAYHQVKESHDLDYSRFKGFNLAEKTLGIIGTGRIGLNVAQIARGFQMNIHAYDPFPNNEKATEIGYEYMDLNEVLKTSDIVTIHVPYNEKTHHLINKENIKLFKKGALLINTARGEVVETEAVLWAIKEKILSGVGLDVLEGERAFKEEWARLTSSDEKQKLHADEVKTILETHMLIEMPEVAITPHIAFFTDEAKREIMQTTVDNIGAFVKNAVINAAK
jgi:D-lactate dehydrogenase